MINKLCNIWGPLSTIKFEGVFLQLIKFYFFSLSLIKEFWYVFWKFTDKWNVFFTHNKLVKAKCFTFSCDQLMKIMKGFHESDLHFFFFFIHNQLVNFTIFTFYWLANIVGFFLWQIGKMCFSAADRWISRLFSWLSTDKLKKFTYNW